MGALARPDHRHPPAPVITQPRDPSLAINHRLKLMVISMFEVPLVHGHALCPSPRSVGRWERDTAFGGSTTTGDTHHRRSHPCSDTSIRRYWLGRGGSLSALEVIRSAQAAFYKRSCGGTPTSSCIGNLA